MKTKHINIGVFIACIAILGIFLYNLCKNENFWDASATTCISLCFALCVSFYIAQKQTDMRRKKEIFIKLLESLKIIIDDEKCYKLDNISQEELLMRKRDISNKIDFVKKCSTKFSIKNDIEFLCEMFNEYNEVIGNHIQDLPTLRKLDKELKRPLTLMSQRITEIMFNLYD